MASNSNCIVKPISGSWLTNGHLEVCILKLISPTENQYKNDESRADNLAIIDALFSAVTADTCFLDDQVSGKPILLLAPELAFGSSDYERLNQLITNYNQNLIFISGFGFAKGGALTRLAENPNVKGAWQSLYPPKADKKYNCGWVWVKYGAEVQCHIFLKNFFEQNSEITIPNLCEGDSILRLEGCDLVIFPLICADLISSEVNGSRQRIMQSLMDDSSATKKVLITGSLLNENSSSGWWKTAIGDLLESTRSSTPRLLLSNCVNPHPSKNEEDDKWRCLSGCYQYLEGCKKPVNPLPVVRFVADTKFAGLVARTPDYGCVFAKLNWSNNPSEGKHALSLCSQYIWHEKKLSSSDDECAADELHRFIKRYKGNIFDPVGFNKNARALANEELDKLLTLLDPFSKAPLRSFAKTFLQKCLKDMFKHEDISLDDLHVHYDRLDCAITTIVLIKAAIGAELMPEDKGLEYGQLLSSNGEHEVLIWSNSDYKAQELYDKVKANIVMNGGSARPLVIVGRGNNYGSPPPEGRIFSDRYEDYSNFYPDKDDICNPRDRVVFWRNQGSIDDILSSPDPAQNLKEELKSKISLEGI